MADNFGLKIGVEGEKEFKNSLREINQSFKVLGSEMKLVSSEFDKNDKSISSLSARNQVLNKSIDAQKEKITTLENALKNASDSFGENDKRTQNWAVQLNNAKAQLNNMEREVANNEKAIDAMGTEEVDAAKKTDELGNELKDTGDEAEKSGSKFEKFGGVLKGIGVAMGTVALAAGAAAVELGKQVVSAYADYEQLVGGVDTLFKDASSTVQKNADNAFKTAGMSANEYMETVTGFSAALISSLGGDIKKAAGVADQAVTDMSDNANKMGTDIESIQNAYQGFAKQNYGMLDNLKLGFGGTKSEMERLLQEAEKISGVKYDISNFADVTEAIHVIQTEMGITGTTAKEASETISGSIDGMKSAISNLMAGLGNSSADIGMLIGNVVEQFQNVIKNILPVIQNIVSALPAVVDAIIQALGQLLPTLLEAVTSLFSQVLETILGLLPTLIPVVVQAVLTIVQTLIENLPLLIDAAFQLVTTLIQGLGEALPELIPITVQAIITIVNGLIENLPLLLDAALQLIMGLAQGLITALPILIESLPQIITGIVNFIISAIPQIIQTGIQLLTSLVTALPDIINAIVAAIPVIIQNIINAVIGAIPQLIDAGIQLLVALIGALPQIITTIANALPQIINAITGTLIGNIDKIILAGVQLLVALIQNLPAIISAVVKAVPQIITGLVNAFGEYISTMGNIGLNLIKGLWNGIADAAGWLRSKISGFFGGVVDSIKDFFGIHSPSTLFRDEIGKNMALGIGVGFDKEMTGVAKTMQDAIPTKLDMPNFDIDTGIHTAIDSNFSMLDLGAKVDALTNITSEMLPALLKAMDIKITLDDGTLVGRLAPEIDKSLAVLKRGNYAY
ncbi:TPA: phage tail protein [Enterococcus faecalis]|nr:phage tail protein [Enterococcus faecalis]